MAWCHWATPRANILFWQKQCVRDRLIRALDEPGFECHRVLRWCSVLVRKNEYALTNLFDQVFLVFHLPFSCAFGGQFLGQLPSPADVAVPQVSISVVDMCISAPHGFVGSSISPTAAGFDHCCAGARVQERVALWNPLRQPPPTSLDNAGHRPAAESLFP